MQWEFDYDACYWTAETQFGIFTIVVCDDGSFDFSQSDPVVRSSHRTSFMTLAEAKAECQVILDELIQESGNAVLRSES